MYWSSQLFDFFYLYNIEYIDFILLTNKIVSFLKIHKKNHLRFTLLYTTLQTKF
jgi:hypothetical protein